MTIDERLDRLAERHRAFVESLEIAHHQHVEEMQEIRAVLAETAEMNRRTEAANRRTEAALRRTIDLGTREARAERQRRRAADDRLDQMITRLAAAQLVTEEKLQRFLQSRTNGGNESK